MKEISKIKSLVGDISFENLKYVDYSVTEKFGIFVPSTGFCEYAITPNHTHPAYMIISNVFQIEAINKNPVFYLATMDGDMPRVRGMLLYKADENEIVFHTAKMRDLFHQIMKNNKVELCFNCSGTQIRISGKLELIEDNDLKDQIANHPTRAFLKPWRESISVEEFHEAFAVFTLKHGTATIWTMDKNLEPKEVVNL